MERCPQEVHDLIAAYAQLPTSEAYPTPPKIAGLAVISRAWQQAVESRCFRVLQLKSTELDEFQQIVTGVRRRYLRVLRYHIVLPPYDFSLRQTFERQADRDANNAAFSSAIYDLFWILKSWEDESPDGVQGCLKLHIDKISSPTDGNLPSPLDGLTDEEQLLQSDHYGMRHRYSYLCLPNPLHLPIVQRIQDLTVDWPGRYTRKLAPQAIIEIAARLPNLISIHGQLTDTDTGYPALRRCHRDNLVHAVESHSFPSSLRDLTLHLDQRGPLLNQAWHPASLLPPTADYDPLSYAVWKATCHNKALTTLHVVGVLDSTLLWPALVQAPLPMEPFWQHLSTLRINFDLITPSSHWYFRARDGSPNLKIEYTGPSRAQSETAMPPGYDSTEQEDDIASREYFLGDELTFSGRSPAVLFRLVPDESLLVPLIKSFARACGQIPHLQSAHLETTLYEEVEVNGLTSNGRCEWGIYFAAPGHSSSWRRFCPEELHDYEEDLAQPRLTFNTRGWSPDESVCKLLRLIGNFGRGLIEKHLDLWETVHKPEEVERLRLWQQQKAMSQQVDIVRRGVE